MKIDLIISGKCATAGCGEAYALKVEGVNDPAFQSHPVGAFKVQGSKLLFKEGWRATAVPNQWICPRCLLKRAAAEQNKRFKFNPEN